MKGRYNMSFWDTIAGHRLSDVLVTNLPEIAKALTPKKQIIQQVHEDSLFLFLEEQRINGKRIIQCIPPANNDKCYYIVIMEEM